MTQQNLSIQLLIFNSSPILLGALYQPQGVLEWLDTLMGVAPQILNEVEVLASMIKMAGIEPCKP